jgi:branched-chain amino acid transport system substrate-binding protein
MLVAVTGAASATEFSVVVLQSLSGSAAFIGAPIKDGMVLAAEEINRRQELGAGNTLKVTIADDATDRAQTLPLLARFAADPKTLLVLGPTSGAVAVAAANSANDLKIPLLVTTNSAEVLKAGLWSSILTQPGSITIPYIAEHAARKLKVKSCTVIGIGDVESYVALQRTFESAARANGIGIGLSEPVKASDSDFSALATKIANRDQDCIFVSAPAVQAANIVRQLRQAGMDPKVRIIGHNSLASPQFIQSGGSAVEGVSFIGAWVAGGGDALGREFAAAYTAKYKTEPDEWAAVGYSGMRVAAQALKRAGPNPSRQTVRDALAQLRDVRVVVGQGVFSVDSERVPHFGMNVLTVKGGRFVPAQ